MAERVDKNVELINRAVTTTQDDAVIFQPDRLKTIVGIKGYLTVIYKGTAADLGLAIQRAPSGTAPWSDVGAEPTTDPERENCLWNFYTAAEANTPQVAYILPIDIRANRTFEQEDTMVLSNIAGANGGWGITGILNLFSKRKR